MKTVWLAIDSNKSRVKAHRFAENARNTVFEWAKDFLYEENLELPHFAKYTDEVIMEAANDAVIQAEETPWLGCYMIKEAILED